MGGVRSSHAPDPALAGELIGAAVRIERHPGLAQLPLEGSIVDETMNLFVVRPTGTDRTVRVPKSGAEGWLLLGEREIPLKGDTLRVRPEDRPKRLLARGPRRSP